MPRKDRKKSIEDLDHAFELALILITIISGIIAQAATGEEKEVLPPIVANIRRISIVFVFPTVFTILAWIGIYLIDGETWKMRLRTYAWGTILILLFFEVVELYTICLPPDYPQWVAILSTFFILISLLAPLIPLLLMTKILKRYKTALKDINFFTKEGKLATFLRYIPFCWSWITFWLAFLGAMYS